MTHALRLERFLGHPPEKVFRALVEPAHLSRWYPLTVIELDARVGGAIRFRDDEGNELHAEITALDSPKVFAFTEIDEEGAEHGFRVELSPENDGCLLVLTHTFDDPTWRDQMDEGWRRCLVALGELLDERA